jgi:hypothetical protein
MRLSREGAGVGAIVCFLARGAVVGLNFGFFGLNGMPVALPSASVGLLIGAIAGGLGRPVVGAAVGAVLSGMIFESFLCVIGSGFWASQHQLLSDTWIYALEMAAAGAIAGGAGGLVGRDTKRPTKPQNRSPTPS